MKFAVPTTQENQVDAHFGHCEFFTVFSVEDGEIKNSQIVESPQGCGCKSNIASVLQEMGVSIMLAGNIGGGAVNVLNQSGIDVVRGCGGDVNELVKEFVKGELVDSGESCRQHESHTHDDGHQCGHNN
ncbi:MAG: NifB/NifX family molybdenum-iron cluster-binding protein [Ignavibacteriales bacterium]|nr:NifB/NifX family molybdenum-iron cluster-binding protein [Ignavibacteriales bacterium]